MSRQGVLEMLYVNGNSLDLSNSREIRCYVCEERGNLTVSCTHLQGLEDKQKIAEMEDTFQANGVLK